MDLIYGLCRLLISGEDVELSGTPDALDGLAAELENAVDDSALTVSGGGVGLKRTTGTLLKVSLDGTTLWIEGNSEARDMVLSAMRGIAQAARQSGPSEVSRHVHIEYLGESDQWRDPNTILLVLAVQGPDQSG
ncbi:Imm32 family immunity protein [Phycicoccus sonneratiae]|uniref:YbaB/EbfC family nucleoid-associated protein n=1 Tax=Phycicoccus sonneratiae TaxID=2807628 RepID=A0ABS2CKT4_9MICO|nr:hypothetical protein [Phycicoccus sonneraticus]MBM6400503.1 hypothetical protein [Phycicoccus sonneraticus]